MRGDVRLARLAAAHLVLAPACAALTPIAIPGFLGLDHILLVPCFALTFAQVGLLGLWAVFSPADPWTRFLGLVTGAAGLEALLDLAFRGEFGGLVALSAALTFAALIVLRWLGFRLARRPDAAGEPDPGHSGLRFSIRGVMALTAAVAVMSALARNLEGSPGPMTVVRLVTWAACFLAVGLLALRAISGADRPLARGLPAVAVAGVLGAFFAYACDAHHAGWVYIILIMMLDAAALLGSLLVLRSCGFRLARRPAGEPDPPG